MLYGEPEFNDRLKNLLKYPDKDDYKHSCYKECEEHAEEMSWHLYGTMPDELLSRARPREDPAVTQYRKENYEPTTKSAADKAINIISKIFNPNLFSIRWKDQNQKTEDLKKYTFEYYPEFNSLISFMKDVLLRKMLADPNAIAVVKPYYLPEKTTETIEPIIVIYGSENVWDYDEEHYLIFIKEEKQEDTKWYYFEYYDKEGYVSFRVSLSPSVNELNLEEIDFYDYNFTEIPVWRLRGKSESLDNGQIIYKSFFDSAAPFWNLSIIHSSDLLGAYINHLYPQKYELSEPCEYRFPWEGVTYPCKGGKVTFGKAGGESHTMDCPSCSGTGWRNMSGPYGVYKYSKEKLSEGDNVGIDPVGYITVPIDAAKMLEDRAEKMQRMGMWAINMDVEDEVGENQSGVAKVIDRSAQYDTLYNVSTVVFDIHLNNAYYFFSQYMFGVSDRDSVNDLLPEINKPNKFDIYSTSDLVNNFKVAKESGLDPNFISVKTQEIISRDLSTNPDLKQFQLLLIGLDPLSGYDPMIIGTNVSKGFVSQEDAVIHFNIKKFVELALKENKNFITLQKEEQFAVIQKYATEFIAQNKPQIDQLLLENRQKTAKVQN